MSDTRTPWLLVFPALLLLFFVGGLPLITVVNFSFHDVFTLGNQFWVGTEWYRNGPRWTLFVDGGFAAFHEQISSVIMVYFARHHIAKGFTINKSA